MRGANDVINGLYGRLYDEMGKENQYTQEFESVIEFEKTKIKVPGQFLAAHKVMGGEGKGRMKFLKVDSRLQAKVAADPTAKFTYMGKLSDPTAKGEEGIIYTGVSFDSVQLMNYKLGENIEVDMPFTFDDYRYVKTIE